jgi:hypothetical protein
MDKREFRFYPLESFYWYRGEGNERRLVGKYIPGNTYNCTAGERHNELREKCEQWAADGKIRIAYLAPGHSFKVQRIGG